MTKPATSPKLKKVLPLVIIAIFATASVYAATRVFSQASSTSSTSRLEIAGPIASSKLDKEFLFPLEDKGKKITEVKFFLNNIEKRDEIIVKGSRATAIKGRGFLILSIKLTSDFDKALQINTKDYFRLTIADKESEFLAPDIHNDPIVVEPGSTESTRVGWAINEADNKFTLHVGEIGKEKTKVDINF